MMKKIVGLCFLFIMMGCTEEIFNDVSSNMNEAEFYASLEGTDSRTYVDDQVRMRWTAEDYITIFKKNTYNRKFMFTGKTGANAGGFKQVSVDDDFWFGYDVDANYAVYPHSDDNSLDETDLFLTVNMPAEQTYVENSFGLGANTMVAVSESGQLLFKNVGSYLRIRLYGEKTAVSSITLTSKKEAIAGEAKITPSLDGVPTCEMTGSGKSIRLTCHTPVPISSDADTPTDFWMVVPPVTMSSGFSMMVTNSEGDTQVFDVAKSFTFERNMYYDMAREVTLGKIIDTEGEIPTNQIWYTSSDNSIIEPTTVYFGANIVSNTYSNNQGVITFDGDVTAVGSFKTKTKLLTMTIPKTVKSIGNEAFMDCTRLSAILGEGVERVSTYTFYNCGKLEKISFPNLSSINSYAFQDCISLKNVDLSKITYLGYASFKGCTNLETVIMPATLSSSIYDYCFYGCSSLNSIVIPEGVTSIGREAFSGCSFLKKITIPSTLRSTDFGAFGSCNNIEDVYISDIEQYCKITWYSREEAYRTRFHGEHNLYLNGKLVENLELSENTTKIEYQVFDGCISLKSIIIPESVVSIGEAAFNGCVNLQSVTLPNNLASIESDTFNRCSSLSNIKLPDGLSTIKMYAFSLSGLIGIVIPEDVTLIEYGAFMGCANLVEIYCKSTTPAILGNYAFYNNASNRIIYVPSESVEEYITATIWSSYASSIHGFNFTE